MTVPQTTCKEENRNDQETLYVHIHVKTHERSIKKIKTASEGVQLALITYKVSSGRSTLYEKIISMLLKKEVLTLSKEEMLHFQLQYKKVATLTTDTVTILLMETRTCIYFL